MTIGCVFIGRLPDGYADDELDAMGTAFGFFRDNQVDLWDELVLPYLAE